MAFLTSSARWRKARLMRCSGFIGSSSHKTRSSRIAAPYYFRQNNYLRIFIETRIKTSNFSKFLKILQRISKIEIVRTCPWRGWSSCGADIPSRSTNFQFLWPGMKLTTKTINRNDFDVSNAFISFFRDKIIFSNELLRRLGGGIFSSGLRFRRHGHKLFFYYSLFE